MAKPYHVPMIPHGSGVYNYHLVQSNLNSPFAEYLSVAEGATVWTIFDSLIGEPLPINGRVTLEDKLGFGVELNRDYLVPMSF
jgi:L-rhamnonate dehydratase